MIFNHSTSLVMNSFEYLFIQDDATNVKQIMIFCGVSEADLEQELIYHNGGDSYQCLNNANVHDLERHYLIKRNGTIMSLSEYDFNTFFSKI
jgi:hypothetical protein